VIAELMFADQSTTPEPSVAWKKSSSRRSANSSRAPRGYRGPLLVPLTGRNSLTVGDAVIAATAGLPAAICRSLTWDCGSEMARHATITATGRPVFFAHPHSPWERGSNENLNRIVRVSSLKV
jgi:IS30 family transposase